MNLLASILLLVVPASHPEFAFPALPANMVYERREEFIRTIQQTADEQARYGYRVVRVWTEEHGELVTVRLAFSRR